MRKKKTTIILMSILVITLVTLAIIVFFENNTPNSINENDKNDSEIINEIKNEINATADTEIYQIETEYDGRNIIQIKPNIQYDTVLAGILKNDKPAEEEIDSLLENRPNKTGIWISSKSREVFLEILHANNINDYEINQEGYLYKKGNTNNEELNKIINSENLYIIDISGTCYIRDDISGEIIEYPFEKMDPYQVMETYTNENSVILEITTNQKQKLSNEEIFEVIISKSYE